MSTTTDDYLGREIGRPIPHVLLFRQMENKEPTLQDVLAEVRSVKKEMQTGFKEIRTEIKLNAGAIKSNAEAIKSNAEAIKEVSGQVAKNAEAITELKQDVAQLPAQLAVRTSPTFQDHEERIERLEKETGLTV